MSRYRASLGIVTPRGLPADAQSPRLVLSLALARPRLFGVRENDKMRSSP